MNEKLWNSLCAKKIIYWFKSQLIYLNYKYTNSDSVLFSRLCLLISVESMFKDGQMLC